MRPPSVDNLARSLTESGLPHPLLVDIARSVIADAHGDGTHVGEVAAQRAADLAQTLLQPVINATGVLLHTNMGRAPRRDEVIVDDVAPLRYTNLELNLARGDRGSRHDHAAALMARLVGAEAAIIVNNCASAVMLVLAALADGQGVAVSRSELVEIGGGFRVPEVMEQSGARLVEVGTTNRTRLADFERVMGPDVALALQVHQSNYKIIGFTESVDTSELATLDVPVIADIGSGLIDAACPWLTDGPPSWLADEPAARQTLAAGADVITFSGDKLMGGPQAGIIAGRADLVERCRRHPLNRALRPGGLVLSEIQQLALAYLDRNGDAIAFWRLATTPVDELRSRAAAVVKAAGRGAVAQMASVPGGGTLPGIEIPSAGIIVEGNHMDALRHSGHNQPPVVARVADNATLLDLRTVDPTDDAVVAAIVGSLPGPMA